MVARQLAGEQLLPARSSLVGPVCAPPHPCCVPTHSPVAFLPGGPVGAPPPDPLSGSRCWEVGTSGVQWGL